MRALPRSPMLAQDELLKILAEGVTSYLEVGVQEGNSLQIVLDAAPDIIRLVLCDTWGSVSGGTGRGSSQHILDLLDRQSKKSRYGMHADCDVTILSEDSRIALPKLNRGTPDWFDLVHIDGGHSQEVAASDLFHGWKVCRGTMVVHDIEFTEGVWPAFYAFAQTLDNTTEVQCYFGGHGTAVIRRR